MSDEREAVNNLEERLKGLTLEQINVTLARDNGMILSKDDPLMVMISIQNAFLREYQEMLEQHNGAVTAAMRAMTQEHLQSLQEQTQTFAGEIRKLALENLSAQISSHTSAMASFLQSVRQHGFNSMVISGLFMLLNVCAFLGFLWMR